MTRRGWMAAGVSIVFCISGATSGTSKEAGPAGPFAVALVHLEQNVSDGDAEVVFEVKGGKEGLLKLAVVAPDGRTVVDFSAPDASTLGVRQFRFESPEPRDFKTLTSAYPAGVYTFTGVTVGGSSLRGESTLDHGVPVATSLVSPRAGAKGVAIRNLKITWRPVKNVTGYVVGMKQSNTEVSLTAQVSRAASTFAVPDGFLLPGTEYQLSIGTVSAKRNIAFVETTFTTAARE